jgi:hypothetical protein
MDRTPGGPVRGDRDRWKIKWDRGRAKEKIEK